MFIRWKKGKNTHTAYLIRSIRVDGKPRHENIAVLCSVEGQRINPVLAWAKLEMKVQELSLTEQEQASIYQSFEKTISRPSTEAIEKEKRIIAGLLAQIERKKDVVSHIPQARENIPLHEDDTLFISWSVKIVPTNHVQYTASLVKRDSEQETTVELGTVDREDLDERYKYGRAAFWFQVHSALCLADVGCEIYEKALRMLEVWVIPLPPDEFIRAMQWKQNYAETLVVKERQAIYRRLEKLDKKTNELLHIRNRAEKYLGIIKRSGTM